MLTCFFCGCLGWCVVSGLLFVIVVCILSIGVVSFVVVIGAIIVRIAVISKALFRSGIVVVTAAAASPVTYHGRMIVVMAIVELFDDCMLNWKR